MSPDRAVSSRRWNRFSLRTLLLCVTAFALVCAIGARYSGQRRVARDWVRRGGIVTYHPPQWGLPEGIGWYLRDVRSVDLRGIKFTVEDLLACQQLPRLEGLYLARGELSDPLVREIGRCGQIKRLALWRSTLHDEQVSALAGLKRLEVLDVHGTRTTEAAFGTWERLSALQVLRFDATLSDEGLRRLAAMQVAAPLPLRLRGVSDVGLRELERLPKSSTTIESLESSSATDAGLRRLFGALPREAFQRIDLKLSGEQLTAECLESIPFESASRVYLAETRVGAGELVARAQGLVVQLNVGRGLGLYRAPYLPFTPHTTPDSFGLSSSDKWCEAVAPHARSIRYLSLYQAGDLPVRGILRKYTSLRHVQTDGELPDGLFEELAELPELETLHVAWNGGVRPRPLEPLRRARKLRRICFTATPYSAEEIRVLGDFPALVELDLHACTFERATLESFPNYSRLRGVYSPAAGPTRHELERYGDGTPQR